MRKIIPIIERPQFVVDASVAAMWQLRDEHDFAFAASLLQDFREARIRLIAPDHIRYEVPSAIRKAWRSGRLTEDQARRAIGVFLGWSVPTVSDDDLIVAAFGHLRNAIAGRFPLALWLTDYVPVAEQ